MAKPAPPLRRNVSSKDSKDGGYGRESRYRVPYTNYGDPQVYAVIVFANDKGEALSKAKQYMADVQKSRKTNLRLKWGKPTKVVGEKINYDKAKKS